MTPIRPDVDADLSAAFTDDPWLSTEASIDPESGERSDPFETISPDPRSRG